MEDKNNASEIKSMFEIMSYNDKMIKYRQKYNRVKNNIITCSLSSDFVIIVMFLFEIYNSWDTDKAGIGFLPMVIFCIICIPILIIIVKKLVSEYFLIISAISVLFVIVTFSLIPLIIGVMNASFYFCTRSINDIRKLEGYPLFLPIEKNKYM